VSNPVQCVGVTPLWVVSGWVHCIVLRREAVMRPQGESDGCSAGLSSDFVFLHFFPRVQGLHRSFFTKLSFVNVLCTNKGFGMHS